MAEDKLPAKINPDKYRVVGKSAEEIKEVIEANLGGGTITPMDLDRIKVPSGGGIAFAVPTLEGEKAEQSISGIIIHWKEPRAYWATGIDETGGGQPPDCWSDDAIRGHGSPGGNCADCSLSKFGSATRTRDGKTVEGLGQACKQMRMLFMIRQGDLLPICIACPPTSLKPVRKYFLRLANDEKPFYTVVTELTLTKEKNQDGVGYAAINPKMASALSDQQIEKIASYAQSMRPILDAIRTIPEASEVAD